MVPSYTTNDCHIYDIAKRIPAIYKPGFHTLHQTYNSNIGTVVLWKYWPTLLRSQTVRPGAHGFIQSKRVKANLNFCVSLYIAILSGSEFQYFIVLGKNEYL